MQLSLSQSNISKHMMATSSFYIMERELIMASTAICAKTESNDVTACAHPTSNAHDRQKKKLIDKMWRHLKRTISNKSCLLLAFEEIGFYPEQEGREILIAGLWRTSNNEYYLTGRFVPVYLQPDAESILTSDSMIKQLTVAQAFDWVLLEASNSRSILDDFFSDFIKEHQLEGCVELRNL